MDQYLDKMHKFGELFNTQSSSHYYGDTVRKIFVVSGVVMLFLLPFFTNYIPVSTYASLFAIVVLQIVAGITNPLQRWTVLIDMVASCIGLVCTGYFAIDSYMKYSAANAYFWSNQLLGILFLIAFYFSIKSVRGAMMRKTL